MAHFTIDGKRYDENGVEVVDPVEDTLGQVGAVKQLEPAKTDSYDDPWIVKRERPADTEGAGDGYEEDFFKAAGARPGGFAVHGKRDIGIGEQFRAEREARTGERNSTASAIAKGIIPFYAKIDNIRADLKTQALEEIVDGSALVGFEHEYTKQRKIADLVSTADLGGSSVVNSPEWQNMSADEKLKALHEDAIASLQDKTAVKQAASGKLASTREGTLNKIVVGAGTNTGYTLEFVIGSILGGGVGGFLIPAASSATERSVALHTNDYYLDAFGNPVSADNARDKESAIALGVLGGAAEAGIESFTGKALGGIGKGSRYLIGQIPGAEKNIIAPLSRFAASVGDKAAKLPGATTLRNLGSSYKMLKNLTQFGELPEEDIEETIQPFFDDIIGLNKKHGEWTGFASEWKAYKDSVTDWSTHRDVILGMVGTMVAQGAAGRQLDKMQMKREGRSYNEIFGKNAEFVRTPEQARGRLELIGINKGDIAKLTDRQAMFLAKLSLNMSRMSDADLRGMLKHHEDVVVDMGNRIINDMRFEYDSALQEQGMNVSFRPDGEQDLGNGITTLFGKNLFQKATWFDADGKKCEDRRIHPGPRSRQHGRQERRHRLRP